MLLTPPLPCHKLTPSRTPSPLERDVLYGRPLFCDACCVAWFLYYRSIIHSFIYSGHFYSAPSSPLLLSTDTVSEFHAEAHRQVQVQDLPKVPTWRLERESNPRPSG